MTKASSAKVKKSPLPGPTKKPSAGAQHVLARWVATTSSNVGKHPLHLMAEQVGSRAKVVGELSALVRTHYVSPKIAAQRLADLGAPATAKVFRELTPKTKTARSGDLGEILAAEIAEHTLGFVVPVRRLRSKDGRNTALRGDDIIGIRTNGKQKLISILKGESKSYATLTSKVIEKAAEALDRDRGRPGRHAVLFIATRLREDGDDANAALAVQLEGAVVDSFSGCTVEQFLFVLTATNPNTILTSHLTVSSKKMRARHAVGLQIIDHPKFIAQLFGGL